MGLADNHAPGKVFLELWSRLGEWEHGKFFFFSGESLQVWKIEMSSGSGAQGRAPVT